MLFHSLFSPHSHFPIQDMGLTKNDAIRLGPGKYKFFGDANLVQVKLVGNQLSVKAGAGYISLRRFLNEHRPA